MGAEGLEPRIPNQQVIHVGIVTGIDVYYPSNAYPLTHIELSRRRCDYSKYINGIVEVQTKL